MNKEIKAKPVVFNDLPDPSDNQVDDTTNYEIVDSTPKKLPVGTHVDVEPKRIYLKTEYKDKCTCKALKCTWNPTIGKWWCHPNNKLALNRFGKDDNKASENFIEEKDRVYIKIDYDEKDYAKLYGGKWSKIANSWYCHKNNNVLLELYQH
jgi:hypothetical protein